MWRLFILGNTRKHNKLVFDSEIIFVLIPKCNFQNMSSVHSANVTDSLTVEKKLTPRL